MTEIPTKKASTIIVYEMGSISVSQAHPEGQTDGLVTTSMQKTFRSENMNGWQPVLLSNQQNQKSRRKNLSENFKIKITKYLKMST